MQSPYTIQQHTRTMYYVHLRNPTNFSLSCQTSNLYFIMISLMKKIEKFLDFILYTYIYAICSQVGNNWINISKLFQTFSLSFQPLGHFYLKWKEIIWKHFLDSYHAVRQKDFLIFSSPVLVSMSRCSFYIFWCMEVLFSAMPQLSWQTLLENVYL